MTSKLQGAIDRIVELELRINRIESIMTAPAWSGAGMDLWTEVTTKLPAKRHARRTKVVKAR